MIEPLFSDLKSQIESLKEKQELDKQSILEILNKRDSNLAEAIAAFTPKKTKKADPVDFSEVRGRSFVNPVIYILQVTLQVDKSIKKLVAFHFFNGSAQELSPSFLEGMDKISESNFPQNKEKKELLLLLVSCLIVFNLFYFFVYFNMLQCKLKIVITKKKNL